MLLQVQRVSTVISHTKMRWVKANENQKFVTQVWVQEQVRTQKGSNVVNSTGKLGVLDPIYASKQQSNNTQCAAMHSGLLSKKTH